MRSTTRKNNTYRISIEDVNSETGESLQLEFQDRENLLDIVDKMKQGSGLKEQEATRVAIALRLLGPVMMENRKHALFADFMPHFKSFMHNLKNTVKSNVKVG